ncbi:hypothetical protein [Bradyrhizobium sp. CCGUVB23]|uniref:hypothetical protein n=1 Tax=Bradyrhizobium sp. CCGUVB23 TaxID=2949630 RepID=UPI0020B35180|nr:hypothetical protein [Bradyrhizobium sp. CCGUVB23]MCP3460338.1 hypothetical protein [Bradyrhizobium sp. CCGUVB23]
MRPIFYALPSDDQLHHLAEPQPKVQHLYTRSPSARKQKRVNEIVAAYDRHNAAIDRLRKKHGIDEANQRSDDLNVACCRLVEEIDASTPVTFEGFRAKAKVLVNWLSLNGPGDNEDGPSSAGALVRQLAAG